MKSKHLLFTLLLALFVPWAAQAQNTLPLYENAEATNQYVPFYGWYGDEVQTDQMIYPADQLTAMVGKQITKMVFYWSSDYGSNALCNWVVSLGTTTATTLDGLNTTTSLSQVYSGPMDFNTTDKTMTITFDDSFIYTGDNLLVQFYNPVTSTYEYHRYYFLGVEATGASYCYSQQRNFLPRVTFTYETPSACPKPQGLTVNYTGGTTATATWTGTADTYNIDINGTVTNGVTSPYQFNVELATTYSVKVQAGCGSDWTNPVSFTTDACMPEDMCELTLELTDYYGDGWNGNYLQIVDVLTNTVLGEFTNQNLNGTQGSGTNEVNTFTFAVCDGRQIKFVYVKGAGDYTYPDENYFTIYDVNGEVICQYEQSSTGPVGFEYTYTMDCTVNTCFKPTNITVDPSYTTANLSWQGTNDSYNVRYRTAPVLFFDGFEYGLDNWTTYHLGDENANTYWQITQPASWGSDYSAHGGDNVAVSRSYYSVAYTIDNWLVTPQVTLDGTLKFWVRGNGTWPEEYEVYVSTTGNAVDDFGTTPFFTPPTITSSWVEVVVDLSQFNGAQGYIALRNHGSDKDFMFIDDFGIYGDESAAGTWVNRNTTSTSIELTDLEMETFYEYQLQGVCGDETTDWTTAALFQTLNGNEKHFLNEGMWNVDANWMPEGVPTANQNAHIHAAVTIPSGCEATVQSITLYDGGSITIQDGGELAHKSPGTVVTIEKNILGYTGETDRYYLISSTGGMSPTDVTNLLTGEYDFYSFDGEQEGEEWRNYETSTFNMANGMGYLYANDDNVTLRFTNTLMDRNTYYYCGGSNSAYLTYNTDTPLGTFSLVGNTFTSKGYLYLLTSPYTPITDFYVMNQDGTGVVPNENPYLLPNQGAFIEATAENQQALISGVAPSRTVSNEALDLTVKGNTNNDVVRIRFAEGRGLEKFQLNPNHSKLYIPQDNKDFAVAYAGKQGEMPVNFKAETNGTYTISYNTKNVDFSYLHLIDNMTGADIDLLKTPSYSFEAKTTDYASRFRLVYATGSSVDSDSFAFINGMGNLCIFGIEGNATVQVIDALGRVISSETFSGSFEQKLNAAPGVYMVRLIQGNDVKVQKMVIR